MSKKYFCVNRFSASRKSGCDAYDFKSPKHTGRIAVSKNTSFQKGDAKKTDIVFEFTQNASKASNVELIFEEPVAPRDCFVFAPAALYNGNRFMSINEGYPPMLTAEQADLCKSGPVIADIPRLAINSDSCVQLSVGDLSVPCVGCFSESSNTGMLLFFNQCNEAGNLGVNIVTSNATNTESFSLSSPCVRERHKYSMCTTKEPSDDRGILFRAGDKVTFSFTEYRFSCNNINEFMMNHFFEVRTRDLPRSHPDCVPWSYAAQLIENKYNERNWLESGGFYKSSEAESSIYRQWQTGWVGGCISTLPGFVLGSSLTKERCGRTIDFVFDKLQHESGFLYGIYCDSKIYGDDFHHTQNKSIVMSRKNADALYFIAKQLMYLRNSKESVSTLWEDGLKRLADAFLLFYKKNGDLGQFIDIENMKLYIPGSASAAIAPAGLLLCAEYFGNKAYSLAAENMAEEYYNSYVKRGYTNGGPGEILSCPDSESAFAALESFMTLYSFTGKSRWLAAAVDCASICSSWCVAYDFNYDRHTQLYRRGVSTTGAVWASVQNKHAAPGICTLSAVSLFRLYRATGNEKYLELCRDISHNITQYVSTPANPFYASYIWHNGRCSREKDRNAKRALQAAISSGGLSDIQEEILNPTGRINERVNLSDWEGKNNVGEVPLGSCWPEVSVALTRLEVPGVYVQSDTGLCFAFDHVTAKAKIAADGTVSLTLTNPTGFDASYRIFIEKSSCCEQPVSDYVLYNLASVQVSANETKAFTVKI